MSTQNATYLPEDLLPIVGQEVSLTFKDREAMTNVKIMDVGQHFIFLTSTKKAVGPKLIDISQVTHIRWQETKTFKLEPGKQKEEVK